MTQPKPPHAATLLPRKATHPARAAQPKLPHAATRLPFKPPHPATVAQRRLPHAAVAHARPEPREQPRSLPIAGVSSALQLMKRARSGSAWLQRRNLTTKQEVEQYAHDNPDTAGIAIGEWNNDNPDNRIETERDPPKSVKRRKHESSEKEADEQEPAERKRELEEKPLPRREQKKQERQRTKERKEQERQAKKLELAIDSDDWAHILLHTRDDRSKSIHGIYLLRSRAGGAAGMKAEIEPLIAEAVAEWVNDSDRVLAREALRSGKSRAFVIDMQRKIGTMGGSSRQGEPAFYLRVEIAPGRRGKTVVKNAFPADTAELKH